MSTTRGREQPELPKAAGKDLNNFQSFNSALQEAYDQLALSEKRYRELYDNAPDMYHTLDLNGCFVEFNPKHTEVLGYSAEEFQDSHISSILPEDMLPNLAEGLHDLRTIGHIKAREFMLRKKDGSLMPVEIHAMRFDGPDGEPREIRCIMRDITERKKLEEQLLQSQKMESIGRLAGGVAHDFNNLLTAITGYTQIALMSVPPGNRVREYLEQISQATERAATLTRQLLAFSRRQIIAPKVMNLNDAVTNTEKMLRHLFSENIDLTTSLASDLDPVIMDPTQVDQVLMNLALNARDAMPGGGKLSIETANITLKKSDLMHHPDVSPGEYIELTVSDSGTGMSEETLSHIFEPFFTTKEEGKGTGLGLSMCYGIVKQNRGHLSVQSALGQGSAFRIYIPRAENAVTPPDSKKGEELSEGTETILLVEDDPLVRRLSVEVLSQQGYAVLESSDGVEALQLAQDHQGEIHLLLTDVIMPNMDVGELTSHLKGVCPNLKVLFTSGYADDTIVRHGVLEPEVEFMEKPFNPTELLNRVRQVLDK